MTTRQKETTVDEKTTATAPMSLQQMIDVMHAEYTDAKVDRRDQVWAGRLAVALTEIDRRLRALEDAAEIAAERRAGGDW